MGLPGLIRPLCGLKRVTIVVIAQRSENGGRLSIRALYPLPTGSEIPSRDSENNRKNYLHFRSERGTIAVWVKNVK